MRSRRRRRTLVSSGIVRGVILRLVSDEVAGIADVPEAADVVRHAEEDREAHVLRTDAFYEQLRQIARAAPFALDVARLTQQGTVVRLKIAEADHDHVHAVFVRVIARERLAEHFRACIDGPWPRRHVGCDPFALWVEQDRLAGA